MTPIKTIAGLAIALAALLSAPVALSAEGDAKQHCFFSNQFNNWKAADEKTLYIRVGVSRYYRLDLAGACRTALWPDAVLITKFRGSNAVCSAIDWDLQVSQRPDGIPEGCIVSKMTELTAEEVAALPKKAKP